MPIIQLGQNDGGQDFLQGFNSGASAYTAGQHAKLAKQREERQQQLLDEALRTAEDKRIADSIAAEAMSSMVGLRGMEPGDPVPGRIGPEAPQDPMGALRFGQEYIIRDAAKRGASPTAINQLIELGLANEDLVGNRMDLDTMAPAFEEKATWDPIGAAVWEQIAPEFQAEGADATQLQQKYDQLYKAEAERQHRVTTHNLKWQRLTQRYEAMVDPTGPLADMQLTEGYQYMLRDLQREMNELGAPMPTASRSLRQGPPAPGSQPYAGGDRMGVGGNYTGGDSLGVGGAYRGGDSMGVGGGGGMPEPPPLREPQVDTSGPMASKIEKARTKSVKEGASAEQKGWEKTATRWKTSKPEGDTSGKIGFTDETRAQLLLAMAAEIERKGGSVEAVQAALQQTVDNGMGVWGEDGPTADPDLMRDLQYVLTLPADERQEVIAGSVEGLGGGDYKIERLVPWLKKHLRGVGGGV